MKKRKFISYLSLLASFACSLFAVSVFKEGPDNKEGTSTSQETSSDSYVVVDESSPKTISKINLREVGDVTVINFKFYPENATNQLVDYTLDDDSCVEIVSFDGPRVEIKKIADFGSSVVLCATPHDNPELAICVDLYSYNYVVDVNEIYHYYDTKDAKAGNYTITMLFDLTCALDDIDSREVDDVFESFDDLDYNEDFENLFDVSSVDDFTVGYGEALCDGRNYIQFTINSNEDIADQLTAGYTSPIIYFGDVECELTMSYLKVTKFSIDQNEFYI